MDDGVEVLLQVDAFGQAVGRDQQAALGLAELLDLLACARPTVSSPVTTPTVTPLKLPVEVAPEVVRGRDVAAEDDGVEAVRRRARSRWSVSSFSFGSPAWPASSLGLRDERQRAPGRRCRPAARRRRPAARRRRRRRRAPASASSSASSSRSGARAQRLHGGGRARRDAAHERQRSPEVEALAPLVPAGRLDDGRAVVEHGVEEAAPTRR